MSSEPIQTAISDSVQGTTGLKNISLKMLRARGIPGRHRRFKETEIGVVPEEWEVVTAGSVGEVAHGLTVNKARRAARIRAPYLTVANLVSGRTRAVSDRNGLL